MDLQKERERRGWTETERTWLILELGRNWLCQTERKMCSPSGEVRGAKDRGEAGGSRRKVKGFLQNKTKAKVVASVLIQTHTHTHTQCSVAQVCMHQHWDDTCELKRHDCLTVFKHLSLLQFLFSSWDDFSCWPPEFHHLFFFHLTAYVQLFSSGRRLNNRLVQWIHGDFAWGN